MSTYYNGTSAYKIDDIEYGVRSNVKDNIAKRQQVRESKKAAFVKRVRVFATFAGVFAIALGLLFTNAMIIEKSSTVNDMQNELTELTEANNQIILDIEKNLDLKKIEEIAINELGMKRPDKYQIVYVNVEQNDYAEVAKTETTPSGFTATFGAIGSGIGRFMEYIN